MDFGLTSGEYLSSQQATTQHNKDGIQTMTAFSNSPNLLKGGTISSDTETSAVQTIIPRRYNLEAPTRSFRVQVLERGMY